MAMGPHLRRWLLAGVGVSALAAATAAPVRAQQDTQDRAVVAWIDRHANALASTDPRGPLDDLRPLRHLVGAATVVGLGESAHGSHEQFRVKHRMVRFLVEHMGFRTVGFEEDFAGGVLLDRYVTTGEGDPRQLVADMSSPFWASEEILDLVGWMRSYNQTHHDKVRFLGTDVIALRELSFDEVTSYVRHVAPDRLDELERDLAPIRPRGSRLEHQQWYFQRSDSEKRQLIDSARRASQLVDSLAAGPRLEREYARQHARTIVGWYETFANTGFQSERERFIADTVTWWQRTIGGKIAYWAANVHASAAPTVTLRVAGQPSTGTFAGGYLRERLGRQYLSIGTLFHHGVISSDFTQPSPHPVGPPPQGVLEATLGQARSPDYLLDLHTGAPRPVRNWRSGPVTMRMIHPMYVDDDDGAAYTMSAASLIGAFDVIAHIRTTTPSRLFPWTPSRLLT
jgi:erythromycin esterase